MALVLADRVRDTTTTTGTGTVTLSGTAPTGYQTFGAAIGNANTTYYTINAGSQWEVGIGTYTSAGTTLSRDTVLASSNSGSLVDFSVGTKDVFVTYPAEKSVNQNGSVISAGSAVLGVANGGTGATSLTSGYLLKGNGTSAVSASVVYDDGTNVGIGTASPDTKLNVSGTGTIYTKVDSDTAASYRGLAFGDPADNLIYGSVAMELSTNNLRIVNGSASIAGFTTFLTSGSERMRITAAGAVGIGTTSPGTLLEAQKSQDAATAIQVTNTSAGTSASARLIATNGTDFGGVIMRGTGHADAGHLVVYNSSTTAPVSIYTDGTERMRVTNGGDVGIGTLTPATKLQVYGVGRFGTTGTIDINNDGTNGSITNYTGNMLYYTPTSAGYIWHINGVEKMRLNSSGNVGIGTSAPGANLDVKSQINVTNPSNTSFNAVRGSNFGYSSSYNAMVVGATSGNTTVCINVDPSANAGSAFDGNGGEVMFRNGVKFITPNSGNTSYHSVLTMSDGNVGIGTSSPGTGTILDVQSTTAGVRFPNMTTTQKNAITPAAGTVVFDTTLAKLCLYTGSGWQTITST